MAMMGSMVTAGNGRAAPASSEARRCGGVYPCGNRWTAARVCANLHYVPVYTGGRAGWVDGRGALQVISGIQ